MELLTRELAWTRDDPAIDLMFWAAPLSLDRRGVLHVKLTSESLERSKKIIDELHALTSRDVEGGRDRRGPQPKAFVRDVSREPHCAHTPRRQAPCLRVRSWQGE